MSRSRFVVPALALALVTSLSACATFRTPSISQLQSNPGRYVDKGVTVEGHVFMSNPNTNQDSCKGATINLAYAVNNS